MKVLFVDLATKGHHMVYLNNLVENDEYEKEVVLPEKEKNIHCKQYICKYNPAKNLLNYILWLKEIKKIAKCSGADIIQIMQMDSLMKYFCGGFWLLKKYKVVVVFHHFWSGVLRKISYRRISKNVDAIVVHTELIQEKLFNYNISNVSHFEYPAFGMDASEKMSNSVKKILFFGAARYDKGLDILLRALEHVENDFCLSIVGSESDIKVEIIEELCQTYREKVVTEIRYVSEEEMNQFFLETDIVVLPYRKIFDGASGPLTEGVIKEKAIIGPRHGSLQHIIEDNHLGYTFVSEDERSLACVIEKALETDFEYDEIAMQYKKSLLPITMRNSYFDLYKEIL